MRSQRLLPRVARLGEECGCDFSALVLSALRSLAPKCLPGPTGIRFLWKPEAAVCLLSKLKMKEWLQIKEKELKGCDMENEVSQKPVGTV